jgi:glycosyltransferase involved in cell wall biosynthesis
MVGQRKKIGILFSYNEGWIGGTYYFINLVLALLTLPEKDQPHIIVFADSEESFKKMKETGYPFLSYLPCHFNYNIVERVLNKASRTLVGRNIVNKGYPKAVLPVLFGYQGQIDRFKCADKIYWIPDLQEKYYPQYAEPSGLRALNKLHNWLAYHKTKVVFSSKDSLNSFLSFFPNAICKQYVLQFAVTLPGLDGLNGLYVKTKYNINVDFYISPNQFWPHKNHSVVIDAVFKLKNLGKLVTIVFTGNEKTSGGHYALALKAKVHELGLDEQIRFLGFIDRKEQLLLMQQSIAVIQPSLFEGWSTVIEDAKALGKFVIASSISVHKEQLSENCAFFDEKNPDDLANLLNGDKPVVFSGTNYSQNIKEFAKEFVEIF